MIKNKLGGKRSGKRILAMFLAVLMVVTATDFSTVLGVQAKSNDTKTITGFTALADNIKEQQVPLGSVEEDLNLPDTLTVTVETEVLEEVTEPQESVSGNDTEATTEAGIIPTTESGTETETISETETKVEETTETSNDAVTVETEEVTLEGITWELDAEASAKETFDGGITPEEYFGVTEDGKPDYASATQEKRDAYEDMNGAYYTYKPVIPEEYPVADGVELPEIIVMVGENQISLMTLDSTTFDVANGQILIQAGTNDTNKIVVTQNGDTTAELSSDTNITITGTDMEASAASGSGFVYVDGVTANITFDNLKLGLTGGYGSNFKAASNSKITLTLVGENTFTNKLGTYGFNAGKTGSTTTIKGSGSLDVAAESAMYVRDCTIQGGTVKTQSSVSYGIQGGGYLTILGSDTIVQAEATTTKSTTQSGILVTGNLTISDGATVTGISTSGRGIQTQQASGQVGSILFENAHITAKGATDGIYSIDCPLTIKGGMVEATAMTETPIDTDSITITGGSIKSMDQKGTVSYLTGDTIKNEAGTVVTGRTLTLVKDVNTGGTISEKATSNTAITSLNFSGDTSYTYGTTGMKTDEEGRLYVYLPEGVFVSSVVIGTGTSQEVYELVGEAGESSVYKAKMEQEAFSINGDTDRLHYGDTSKDTFTLETTGGSGSGKVTYEITEGSDAAEVVADTGVVTTKKAGSFTITATKAGDETYKSITATKTFTVQTAVARVTLANGSKTDYGSLEAAITEAQKTENSGCKVTLLDNVDITSKITVTSKFTLDLNGKTAKRAGDSNWQDLPTDALFFIGDGGDLTVEDTGTGGTIKRDDNYGGIVLELYSGGCLTVNSGNIVGNGSAIYQTSASTLGTAVGKITLNGGSVTDTDIISGRAVYAYNLEITGGTYTGVTALQASHNNAKIELCGGTFIGTVSTKSAQAPSVASLLAPGYAFKKDGAWVNDTTVTSLSGTRITVEQAPVKITTQPTAPATLKYGETATLTVGTDVTEGVSYQWYLDNSENAIDGEVSASYTTSNTLSVGEHTFACKVTKDGYTVAATPVTITVGQAEGIVSDLTITGWTYGSYSADTNQPSSTSSTNTGVTPVYEYKLKDSENEFSTDIPEDAGNYTLRVTYPETTNYKAATDTFNFTIEPKTLTVDMFESIDGQYFTGSQITPSVSAASSSGLTTSDYEVKADGYGANDTIGASTGSVTVSGKGNYTGDVTLNFAIKYYDGTPVILYNNTTKAGYYNQAVAITATGYTISDSLTGPFALSYSLDGAEGTVSKQLYFKQDGTGYITDAKTVDVQMDKSAPTFTGDSDGIQITSHDAWWQTLLKVITFGMYKTQNGTIHATDAKSGIETYKYYIDTNPGTTALTADELDALDVSKWTSTTGSFSMDTEGKYVVYAYAVDKVGNRSAYICTDGIVIDNTAPTVTATVPEETKKDVTATLHITSTETGSFTYLISETDKTYTSLEGVAGIETGSITEEQVTSGADIALKNLSPNKTYYVYVAVTDAAGNTSMVAKISFTTTKTQPIFATAPTLTGTYGDKVSELKINGTVVEGNGVEATSDNNIAGHWTITEANAATIIPSVSSATAYEITFIPDDTAQYETITRTIVPTVVKKNVTVTVTDAQKTYGTENPTFDFTVPDGALVGTDTKTALGVSLQCAASQTANVGKYDITGTSTSTNYNVTVTKGILTVNKADAVITIASGSETVNTTFGDASFDLTGISKTGDGTLDYEVTDSKDAAQTGVADDKVITVSADGKVTIVGAGTATITVKMAATTNYNPAASKTIFVTVNKKRLSSESVVRSYAAAAGSGDTQVTINIAEAGNLSTATDRGTTNYSFSRVTDDNSILVADSYSVNPVTGVLIYKVDKDKTVGNTASIMVKVKMENYTDYYYDLTILITDKIAVEPKPGTNITLNGNELTYGDALSKLTFKSAVFVEQGTDKEVAGTLAWTDATTKPDAGTTTASWTFTPENQDMYATVTGTVAISVSKATPTVETPTVTGFTYDPGKSLSSVDMKSGTNSVEGSWSWKTGTTVPVVNNSGYTAIFTPSDTTNYNTVEKTVTVAVAKATPVVNVLPTASVITYGQTLKNSILSNGTAKYSSADGAPAVDGVYTWTTGTTKPAVSDSGVTEYSVTFTPAETANYNSFTAKITLTVNKATNAPNMPGTAMAPAHAKATVGDVSLPTDWIWNTSDATKTLSDGVAVTATAIYNGADKGNYENESVEITLTRVACEHANTEIRNAKASTCTEAGYTGDTYCKDCNTLISSGTTIAALGHTGGTATCKEHAVCDRCHKQYGALDPSNHTHTEIRNAKNATCTAEGYTGDKYCSDCGTKLSSGTTIAALGHNYVGKITKQPTTTEEGVRTYTCTRCGDTYTESIPKLPENHKHSYTETITKQPTCIEAGVKTFTCSCGDSYTESIAALGHNYVGKITKQPTTTEEGVMTYTCSRCGASYTKPIAKLSSDATEPQIKGDDGKKGWEVISDNIEKAKEGDTITVDMKGTTTVPGNVIDSIKGRDITVVIDLGNGISWKINGKDVTSDKVGDIDFGVTTGTNTIPVDVVNEVTGEKYSIQISLAYDGEFGFTATLSVNMEEKNAGFYANLFYYNESTGKLEFMDAGKINTDGTVDLTFTHASDYTIVVSDVVMDGSNTGDTVTDQNNGTTGDKDTTAAQTGDRTDMWKYIWLVILGGIILIIGFGTIIVKKRKETEE